MSRRLITAAVILILALSMAMIHSGGKVNAEAECDESGAIYSNQTWSTSCIYVVDDVTIQDGVTITIDPGAIVKIGGYNNIGIEVQPGGTLDAIGSSEDPITFTSINDDTAGGSVDGSSGTPAVGNYESAVAMNGGTADIQYSDFKYGWQDIGYQYGDGYGNLASGSDLTVTDSSFTDSDQGVAQDDDDSLSLERNSFALDTSDGGSYAITADGDSDLSGVVLSGDNENTFSGSGANVTVSADGTVASDSTWTLDSDTGGVVRIDANTDNEGTFTLGSNAMLVNSAILTVNGTVNIDSGAIIKTNGTYNIGFKVNSGGTLDATGTSESPIIFTSINDDTAGGSVYGSSGSPAVGDYESAVAMNGGTADIQYSDFKYGVGSVDDQYYSDSAWGPGDSGSDLTVTNSSFTDTDGGVAQYENDSLTLQNNSFALATPDDSDSYAIVANGDPDLSGISLTGDTENTFSGSNANIMVSADGTIPSDTTWTLNSSSGGVIYIDASTDIEGTFTLDSGATIVNDKNVSVNGTVNLDSGSIVKTDGTYTIGFKVNSGGTLDATGTSESPIIFTSINDDTAGGSVYGSSGSPAVGDYESAVAMNGGTADIQYSDFKYGVGSVDDQYYSDSAWGPGDSGSDLTVTNSSFTDTDGGVAQYENDSLTLQNNSFALATPDDSDSYAIVANGDPDLSGISLTGDTENTFSGSNENITIYVDGGNIPSESNWTLDTSSGAYIYVTDNPTVDGELTIDPNVIIKVKGNGFDIGSDGTLNAVGGTDGSHATPIVFTSYLDNTLGTDVNGNPDSTAAPGDYNYAIRFEDPNTDYDYVKYIDFKDATEAIDTSATGTLDVTDDQFTDNEAAINSDTTSIENDTLGGLEGYCLYPYANDIEISNSWFGSSGDPGISVSSVASYLGQYIPSDYPGLSDMYSAFTEDLEPKVVSVSDNTIPATIFTCGIPDTDLSFEFPVTPVDPIPFGDGDYKAASELWTGTNYSE